MNHFYQNITQTQSLFSAKNLYKRAIRECRMGGTVVEVGTWIGQGLAFLAVEALNSGKNITTVGVDTFPDIVVPEGIDQWTTFKHNLLPVWHDIVVLKHESSLASNLLKDVDFVFIDACHDYKAVTLDVNHWWGSVREGGLLCGHDISHNPVRRAVCELCEAKGVSFSEQENSWIITKDMQ